MKQRILGLVILIALAVIFVPFLFQHNVNLNAVQKQPEQTQSVSSGSVQQVQQAAATPEMPAQATTATLSVASQPPKPTAVAVAKPDHPAKPVPEKHTQAKQSIHHYQPKLAKHLHVPKVWYVQLGSFSEPKHVKHLVHELRHKGFKAYVRRGRLYGKAVEHVRVGPMLTRKEADQVRDKLKQDVHLKGIVRRS